MSHFDVHELRAVNVASDLVTPFSCIVASGKPSNLKIASGTLFTLSGRKYVCSVSHLLDALGPGDQTQILLGNKCKTLITSVADWKRDQARDIALLDITDRCEAAMPAFQLARPRDPSVTGPNSSLWLIVGTSARQTKIQHGEKVIEFKCWSLGIRPLPRERWPLLDSADYAEFSIFAEYSNTHATRENGRPMDAVPPIGFSGGGIWAIDRRLQLTGHADTSAHLIGIQTSTAKADWRWLRATKIEYLNALIDER